MSLRVAIHQPQYWPWPPYLHKALTADVFVYLDTVQFSKNGLQNRNQVKTAAGATWLTLPVRRGLGQAILEAELADPRALERHGKTLAAAYAGAPGYERWRDDLAAFFAAPRELLAEAAIDSTEWLLERVGAGSRRVRASELEGAGGRGSALVASICEALGATEYLSGRGGLTYMERSDFERIGCGLRIQAWRGLAYEQRFPEVGFVPDLSALDLLLNRPDDARALIDEVGGWTEGWPE